MMSFIQKYKYLLLSFVFMGLFFASIVNGQESNIEYDMIIPQQALSKTTIQTKTLIGEGNKTDRFIKEPIHAVHHSNVKRIIIKDKSIDQNVIPVGVDDLGRVATANNAFDLTWYARTGENITNIIISGHRDYGKDIGVLSGSEAWDKDLELEIEFENGEKETFVLTQKYNYKPDETPSEIMNTETGEYRVTLITCVGEYIKGYGYEERIYNIFTLADKDDQN